MKHTPPKTPVSATACRGFTIIEVMVALTISAVLLFGVTNIFMASRTSYALQSGASRIQENARFALDNMARNIGMAGLEVLSTQTFTTANTQDNVDENATLGFTQAAGNASDRIEVNYVNNDPTSVDCLGNAAVGAVSAFYWIGTETLPDGVTQRSNLYCTTPGQTQPLVEGVENLQILYGEDGNADGIADRYVSAADVTDWGGVSGGITSIRIAILVSTVDDAGVTDTRSYNLLDAATMGPFNDNSVRRVFTRTILLRNYAFTP
jgi:type IV pilus assembly protein PilW